MLSQRLRHRAAIQRPTVTQNPATGAKTEGWAPVLLDEPCEKYSLSGSETLAAATMQGNVTHRWTFRYHPELAGITPAWRIVHNDVAYNIAYILPDFKETQWLTIMTGSGVNNG